MDAIPFLPNIKQFDLIYIEETAKNKSSKIIEKISFTDKKITYKKRLNKIEIESNEIVEYTSKRVNKNLLLLAIQSASFSRFKLDEKFKKQSYKKLYSQWIKNSVIKKSADIILVYGKKREPKGFITLVFKSTYAQIGLIAVGVDAQNQGIGKALINAAANYATKNNFTTLHVVTQSINKEACIFYERCGFKKQKEFYTHHYWNK